jgi:glycosyltransferase domain-containing protein
MTRSQSRAAVLVPTYRKTPQVLANLAYLAALSSPEIHFLISDCSADPEKKDYLNRLEREHPCVSVVCRPQRTPLYRDLVTLLEQARYYDYVSICADDDYISLPYLTQSIELLDNDKAAVCAYGNYLLWVNGNIDVDSWEATDSSPVTRLQSVFEPTRFNTLLFSVFRRSAMQPWINFCTDHPMIAAFFDFIHLSSLLVQGTIRHQPNGFYLWTGENWDTSNKNYESKARYYCDVGLPAKFTAFHDLHFAIEGINFFVGEYCPILDLNTRLACAQTIWSRCMTLFRKKVYAQEEDYAQMIAGSSLAIDALRFLLQKEACDDTQILSAFEAILAVFSEPLAKEYAIRFCASVARAKVCD